MNRLLRPLAVVLLGLLAGQFLLGMITNLYAHLPMRPLGRRPEEDTDMATAARIFGDEVGSTAPVFLAFLAVHGLAGMTAVVTGAIAALVRKGSPRHIRAGRWYYRAISVVFATATVLAAMPWRQDYYLFIIGAVAFTAATIGYLHRRRRRPGDTGHIAGMGAAYVAMLTAFYVDNGPHLPVWDHLPPIAFWLLPSAIGAPIITRALIRARRATSRPLTSKDT